MVAQLFLVVQGAFQAFSEERAEVLELLFSEILRFHRRWRVELF